MISDEAIEVAIEHITYLRAQGVSLWQMCDRVTSDPRAPRKVHKPQPLNWDNATLWFASLWETHWRQDAA